jgi:hypothetical protein
VPIDYARFGEHDQMGAVNLRSFVQFGSDRIVCRLIEQDAPSARRESP